MKNDTFLRACRLEPVRHTPVWIMRQAGRYLPDYRKIREKVDFLTLCKTPELAAEVTLQPVRILGVDAAILFSDILIPVEAMGMELFFSESKGPVFPSPLRDEKAVAAIRIPDPAADTPFVPETIRILTSELEVPLIGFAGAPFTTATYMIEGGTSKNFINTKRMMYCDPELFSLLMEKITATVIRYLDAQIRAGVSAVQLFDTWAGALSPADYAEYALPSVRKIFQTLKQTHGDHIPFIYFAYNGGSMLDHVEQSGADVLGLDWRIRIADAAGQLKSRPALQGNLDPCVLFGDRPVIRENVRGILEGAKGAAGHIFNLGHGVLPETPPDNVKALVEIVREESLRDQTEADNPNLLMKRKA